jgi:hypothetical protein
LIVLDVGCSRGSEKQRQNCCGDNVGSFH